MRKLTFLLVCLFCVGVGIVNSQTVSVSGKVLSAEDGQPIVGATVKVKGTTNASLTDVGGNFTISMKGSARTLLISFIGMNTQEVVATNDMIVKMESNERALGEVVVTGLGIKRDQKALGYSATSVTSADITATGNRSAFNALEGKVPGVEITSASGAPGASTRVIMRGFSSLSGSNQPLYVIDGVPVNNTQIGSQFGTSSVGGLGSTNLNGGLDFGNRANDINPEDIESITILQGGSGTALYGSRASSGVIIITTKNGSKANNKAKVEVSSTTSFENPLRLPTMQNEFGQGWYDLTLAANLMENGSWGPRFDGKTRIWGFEVDGQQQIKPYVALKDNVKDFFDTGVTTNNTVAISNGDENKSFYMSYGNVSSDGIMPTSADSYQRNNISVRGSSKFLKIFTASASLNFIRKDTKYVPTGQQQSVLDGLWQTARDISVVDLKDYNNKFNNVDNYYTAYAQNPYFLLSENGSKFVDSRVFGNINLDAKITPWLKATLRVGDDVSNSTLKTWRAIYNSSRFDYENDPGRDEEYSFFSSELNEDFMLNISNNFTKDLTFNAVLGQNFNQRDGRTFGAEVIGLSIPGLYSLSNSASTPTSAESITKRRLVGVYGSLDFGYKNLLYLNLAARNDWSSTLPASNRSYFYPGASLSFVFTELLGNQDILSFGKIRAGIAQTGKDADPYLIYTTLAQTALTDGYRTLNFPLSSGVNGFTVSNTLGNDKLKPEISTDKEFGLNLKFFNNRIGLDASVYNKTVKDLIWATDYPYSTGFTAQTENIGKITNNGFEFNLTVEPIQTKDLTWDVYANFSTNKNKLVSLIEGLDQITLGGGGTSTIGFVGRPGQELGLFEGAVQATDGNGHVVVDNQGLPVYSDTKQILGSSQNKYRLGGGTTLTYKGISLHAAVDYRKGGLMYSRTAEMMYFTGNAVQTVYNDRQPFIIPNSVQAVGDGTYVENTTPIAGFTSNLNLLYNQTYNPASNVLVSKTFFKLRELSLGYSFPKSLLKATFISSLDIALVGTNLLLWTPASNTFCDPEQTTFGNDIEANFGDYGATPSTRSIGFNIKLGI